MDENISFQELKSYRPTWFMDACMHTQYMVTNDNVPGQANPKKQRKNSNEELQPKRWFQCRGLRKAFHSCSPAISRVRSRQHQKLIKNWHDFNACKP